ncbi:helix-turn-helix domain-containing protein [Methylosinus sp. PW1]|uniref:helix-turn-helix domain-containing protein n=1 Tax=Methylosinus sp. PW1 TaxID=107636 RepID=UPI00056A246D|nr:helix-turn-helix domain-containing protein [Methylosinus sp. PW1]
MRTEKQRSLVLKLHVEGVSKHAIAKRTGVPRSTVQEWIKKATLDDDYGALLDSMIGEDDEPIPTPKPVAPAEPEPDFPPPPEADDDDLPLPPTVDPVAPADPPSAPRVVGYDNCTISAIADQDNEPPSAADEEEIDFPSNSELDWCEQTREGWIHYGGMDVVGEGRNKAAQYDPGVVFPAGWSGPFLHDAPAIAARRPDGVKRWLLTAAQNETPAHGPALVNLLALSQFLGAEFRVGKFTYNRDWYSAIFGGRGMDERVKKKNVRVRPYSSNLEQWLTKDRLELSETIVHCAEVNIIPTAERPLSGLLTYGRGKSTVFSHPKQELESIPRSPEKVPVVAMTTGVVTCHNYVPLKAGYKASFHHVIGALLIEVDADGYVYSQHVHCDPADGRLQVYDVVVDRGVVTTGNRIAGMSLGDTHVEHVDTDAVEAVQVAIDRLQPAHVFSHDTTDFYARNHHTRNDPWHAFEVERDGRRVEHCFRQAADFLSSLRRNFLAVHAIESNHDLAFSRWLRETDWRTDPQNAELHLEANLRMLRAIKAKERFSIWEWAIRRAGVDLDGVEFILADEGFALAGVECGWHGDNGPNGSRGSSVSFMKLAEKVAHGHTHTAFKRQGVASGGTIQQMMPKYARGPSSWSQSFVAVYPNGQTGICFIHDGRAFASGRKRTQRRAAA